MGLELEITEMLTNVMQLIQSTNKKIKETLEPFLIKIILLSVRIEAEQFSCWLKTKREALAQDGILKEACVNPTRQDYQTLTSLGKQERADLCPMPVAAELVFTCKARSSPQMLRKGPGLGHLAASGITVFPVIGERKQASILK